MRGGGIESRLVRWLRLLTYAFATWQLVRVYLNSTHFYLRMSYYLSGTELMPYQGRILPAWIILAAQHISPLEHFLSTRRGAVGKPGMGVLFLICLVALPVTGYFAQKIYRLYSRTRPLDAVVYPLLLVVFYCCYGMHVEQNFSYPYDTLSLAFFTAGLYFVLADEYLPLLLVMLVGSFNRETTLFLLGLFVIHQAITLGRRSDRAMWVRAAVLGMVWLAIRVYIRHRFAFNDHSDERGRLLENAKYIANPTQWPALLNICGYMLPWVVLLRRGLPQPVRTLLWILPFWFGVMLFTGMMLETRIYGELAGFTAVAVVLLMERAVETGNFITPVTE